MEHSTEMTSIDDQIPLLPQTKIDEIEEGRKVNHKIDINERIGAMFKDLDNSSIKSHTIFKVNARLRKSDPGDAYTPKVVSIGPYHRKNPQLLPMEKYKLLYLRRFLIRNERLDVKSCISELEKLKDDALKCYEDIEDLDTDEFCQMLLLDGCFVVEFIREHSQRYSEEEIIIFAGYMYHQVFRDLMLLENQLPFFVLDTLYRMTKQDNDYTFLSLAIVLFVYFLGLTGRAASPGGDIKHLLHLAHITSSHGHNPEKKAKIGITRRKALPNATELLEAGVRLVRPPRSASLFDIKFENELMTIPPFEIFSYTETLLRNLIAYEQQSSDVLPTYFSDYVTFMCHLINSDKDAALLQHKGIIQNWTGEDKEVVSLFNRLGNGIGLFSTFHYDEQCLKAIEHCEKPSSKLRAFMMHNYFNKPWARASTVAAIILFILTTMQTILAFLQIEKGGKWII